MSRDFYILIGENGVLWSSKKMARESWVLGEFAA